MSKIFGENQKVLVSMKGMIDTLTSTLEHIQKQSKQINSIEEDTQKLYAGLNQVRTQSNLIDKINNQTEKLENELKQIAGRKFANNPICFLNLKRSILKILKNIPYNDITKINMMLRNIFVLIIANISNPFESLTAKI